MRVYRLRVIAHFCLLLTLSTGSASKAHATLIAFGFEGVVDEVIFPASTVSSGDLIQGIYIYDDDATLVDADAPGFDPFLPTSFYQRFEYTGYVAGVVGSEHFAFGGTFETRISNDVFRASNPFTPCMDFPPNSIQDQISINGNDASGSGGIFRIDLYNCAADAYDAADYPLSIPLPPTHLGNGAGEFLTVSATEYPLFSFPGNAFSWDLTKLYRVPEPGTTSLLGMGLLGFSLLRRRRRAA